MRPQVLAALAALAIVMNPSESAADQPSNSNKGDDFWFCMPAGCGADPDLHDGAFTDAWLTITADQSTHAVLTGPGPLGPVVWEGDILGGESVAVAVDPTYSLLHDDAGLVTTKGFHLVSQLPVQAQLSVQFSGSNAAALLLPTRALGTHHVLWSYPDQYDQEGSFVAVVATAGATVALVRPDGAVDTTIMLTRGETAFWRRNFLRGYRIDATAPVAVFSGSECAWISDYWGDQLLESVLPMDACAREFVACRVWASDQRYPTPSQIRFPSYYEAYDPATNSVVGAGTPAHLQFDEPHVVSVFTQGGGYHDGHEDDHGHGDPSMTMLVPTHRWLDAYAFAVPKRQAWEPPGITVYGVSIAMRPGTDVTIDGTLTDVGGEAVGDYVCAYVGLSSGRHEITASAPIGVVAWQRADHDGSAMPAGMRIDVPVADAGPDVVRECSRGSAGVEVLLDGSASSGTSCGRLDHAWGARDRRTSIVEGRNGTAIATIPAELCDHTEEFRLVVTNELGLTATDVMTVRIVDTRPPELPAVASPIVAECEAVPPPAAIAATDACDPDVPVAFSESRADGPCPDAYRLDRTWTAVDGCGLATTRTQVVEVSDALAPILSGVPGDATAPCHDVPPPARPSAADTCDPAPSVSFVEARRDGSCPDGYELVRTWTATDRCGNAVSSRQVVTVVDSEAPALAGVPADGTFECDRVPAPALVTASDACDPAPAVRFTETRIDGRCPGDYVLVRAWQAVDRCGNASAEARQIVTVVDTTPPVVTAAGAGAHCLWPPRHRPVHFTRADFDPLVTDACSGPVSWRFHDCASDQADDANGTGDGSTDGDCAVDPDGEGFAVRAERDGTGSAGRRYAVSVVATDACGNASAPAVVGHVVVPHDAREASRCDDRFGRDARDAGSRR